MTRALAITVSNRASAGIYADKSGPVLAELLRSAGCETDGPVVIPDGAPVQAALREALAAGYDLIVTTGGTGLTPGDLTPEMTRLLIDREIPGIAEAIRAAGVSAGVPAAMLSRGVVGLAGTTLIVNLPGSTGGVRDGMSVLQSVLHHAIDQARGGDHPRPTVLSATGGLDGLSPTGGLDGADEPEGAMIVRWHMLAAGRSRSPSRACSGRRSRCGH